LFFVFFEALTKTITIAASTFVATVKYDDLEYQMLEGAHLTLTFREDLMRHAIELVQNEMVSREKKCSVFNITLRVTGQLSVIQVPIKRCQELMNCYGEVHLAVNGRAGRRVACVLEDGVSMEVLDMEGGEDESEGDGEEGEG
jgi:anaphase-promoting complex subunit 4